VVKNADKGLCLRIERETDTLHMSDNVTNPLGVNKRNDWLMFIKIFTFKLEAVFSEFKIGKEFG
jgi:hypothetical protein